MTSSFYLALSFFAFSCPLTSMADKYHRCLDGLCCLDDLNWWLILQGVYQGFYVNS